MLVLMADFLVLLEASPKSGHLFKDRMKLIHVDVGHLVNLGHLDAPDLAGCHGVGVGSAERDGDVVAGARATDVEAKGRFVRCEGVSAHHEQGGNADLAPDCGGNGEVSGGHHGGSITRLTIWSSRFPGSFFPATPIMTNMATKKRQPEKRLPVPSAFGIMLKGLLKTKNVTLSEFCASIGEDPGHIHRVCDAKRNPPSQGLDKWAAALRLTPAETDDFLDTGYLTACPEYIKEKYKLLKAAFFQAKNR